MRDVSALTIARGRRDHLCNVIRGLNQQSVLPRELVIGVMQPELYADLPEAPFPIRQHIVQRDDGELPLSAARNAVARAAEAEVLAFVDVDCIPHPDFIRDVGAACDPGRGLVMGEVAYLPAGAVDAGLDFEHFDRIGVRHSDRQGPPPQGLRHCPDYRCFWSLNFAMHRDDWHHAGGFDEGYYGYGGEDTDFGRILDARGIDIWWMKGAKVYHQHHDHCMPPIHHVASVLRNADYFASRWGHRTMGHWLHGFHLMGLIDNPAEGEPGGLTILRAPDEADFALCRQTGDMPYANTRRVIDRLESALGTEAERRTRAQQGAATFTNIAAE